MPKVATATMPFAGSTHGPKHENGNGECELLGPFSLLIQSALGLLAISSLVWKRYRERPRRPIKIWTFDVSKQVVGSGLLHVTNLLMSMLSAGKLSVKLTAVESTEEKYQPNPCSFYLLNLAIDTTLGIPILIITLRVLTRAFLLTPLGTPPESIESGNYGQPPKATWWAKQSLIYFLGLLTMKTCVILIFSILPWISRVGDWALRWTEGNEALQVAFVMLIFPVLMNALQYYIIDSFIKGRKSIELESSSSDDEDDGQDDEVGRGGLYRGNRRSEDRLSFIPEEPEEILTKDMEGRESGSETVIARDERRMSKKSSRAKPSSKSLGEYDPAVDGEDRPSGTGADDLREEPLLFPIETESKDAQLARAQTSGNGDGRSNGERHASGR